LCIIPPEESPDCGGVCRESGPVPPTATEPLEPPPPHSKSVKVGPPPGEGGPEQEFPSIVPPIFYWPAVVLAGLFVLRPPKRDFLILLPSTSGPGKLRPCSVPCPPRKLTARTPDPLLSVPDPPELHVPCKLFFLFNNDIFPPQQCRYPFSSLAKLETPRVPIPLQAGDRIAAP